MITIAELREIYLESKDFVVDPAICTRLVELLKTSANDGFHSARLLRVWVDGKGYDVRLVAHGIQNGKPQRSQYTLFVRQKYDMDQLDKFKRYVHTHVVPFASTENMENGVWRWDISTCFAEGSQK
jgi:hypothetical protein